MRSRVHSTHTLTFYAYAYFSRMRFVTERKKNKTKQNKTKNNENEAEFIPRAFPLESPSNNDKKLNILCHPHGCCCYDLNTPLPGGTPLL